MCIDDRLSESVCVRWSMGTAVGACAWMHEPDKTMHGVRCVNCALLSVCWFNQKSLLHFPMGNPLFFSNLSRWVSFFAGYFGYACMISWMMNGVRVFCVFLRFLLRFFVLHAHAMRRWFICASFALHFADRLERIDSFVPRVQFLLWTQFRSLSTCWFFLVSFPCCYSSRSTILCVTFFCVCFLPIRAMFHARLFACLRRFFALIRFTMCAMRFVQNARCWRRAPCIQACCCLSKETWLHPRSAASVWCPPSTWNELMLNKHSSP